MHAYSPAIFRKVLQGGFVFFLLCVVFSLQGLSEIPAPEAYTKSKASKGGNPFVFMSLRPAKAIFSKREGLTIFVDFKAKKQTQLCFQKDAFQQFQFVVFRPGIGTLSIKPIVGTDKQMVFAQRPWIVPLKDGQTFSYRLNLRRIEFLDGETWTPGDYVVKARFTLCDQTVTASHDPYVDYFANESTVDGQNNGQFMILN